jgi:4-hydroxyproline epimerase
VEDAVTVGGYEAIVPSIEGSAVTTGHNTIWIDEEDAFAEGFLVD